MVLDLIEITHTRDKDMEEEEDIITQLVYQVLLSWRLKILISRSCALIRG